MECIIPFKWDVKTLFPHASCPRSRKTGKSYICPKIRDGGCDGELLVGKDDAGEKQEQWKASPWPPEHDDS